VCGKAVLRATKQNWCDKTYSGWRLPFGNQTGSDNFCDIAIQGDKV